MADLVLNPYSYEFHEDPFPIYRRLREEAPAYHNPDLDFWALSRFDDVFASFHDHGTYSSADGIALETLKMGDDGGTGMMITMDPPDHTRFRKLVNRAFTPRRVATMEEEVRRIARGYLEDLARRGEADLVGDFAGAFPMDVISAILLVPEADRPELRRLSDQMLERVDGKLEMPHEARHAALELVGYFADDVPRRRAHPDDGLISALLEAEMEGERLTDDEVIGFCLLFIVAGSETTTKLLGNALDVLERNPDQRQAIIDDPSAIPGAVDEVLRYRSSTQYMARRATRDVRLHDETIPEGGDVVLLIGAANRDEREFADPDRFDIGRRPERTLAFGHGAHFCLGAALARMEGRIALEEIHRLMPDYEIDRDGLKRIHSGNVMGYSRVPVTFTPSG